MRGTQGESGQPPYCVSGEWGGWVLVERRDGSNLRRARLRLCVAHVHAPCVGRLGWVSWVGQSRESGARPSARHTHRELSSHLLTENVYEVGTHGAGVFLVMSSEYLEPHLGNLDSVSML